MRLKWKPANIKSLKSFWIDNAQEYQRVLELVQRILPTLVPRIKLCSKPFPIFEEYGVQAEIDKAEAELAARATPVSAQVLTQATPLEEAKPLGFLD